MSNGWRRFWAAETKQVDNEILDMRRFRSEAGVYRCIRRVNTLAPSHVTMMQCSISRPVAHPNQLRHRWSHETVDSDC